VSQAQASLRAQIADLLGEDPGDERYQRPGVEEALSRCRRGEIRPARDGDRLVAVAVLEDGSAVVLGDECPHDGGLISDGFVEGQAVVCARHGWEFDGKTGRCPHREGVCLSSRPIRLGRAETLRPKSP
jgi:nitrite reductase/ring-hydroxylating ferredoxin subunit